MDEDGGRENELAHVDLNSVLRGQGHLYLLRCSSRAPGVFERIFKNPLRLVVSWSHYKNSGRILGHAYTIISQQVAGAQMQRFKIGVTCRPKWRMYDPKIGYRALGYNFMLLLAAFPEGGSAAMLESACIYKFWDVAGRQNQSKGGEGVSGKHPTYFVYLVCQSLHGDIAAPHYSCIAQADENSLPTTNYY